METLTEDQKAILYRSDVQLKFLTVEKIVAVAERRIDEDALADDELVEFLQVANALYRGGAGIISDAEYDLTFIAELRRRNPHHPYLSQVEPEAAFVGKTVELPVRMLSTEKAYSKREIEQWAARIKKTAMELGKDFDKLRFKVTPKLDGFAAYDDGDRLYTRGDGRRGTDISRVFERGLYVATGGNRGLGAGEIVVDRRYFDENLALFFENPRNFQSSVIKEKELDDHAEQAILEKAAVFYPFALLPSWEGTWQELIGAFDAVILRMRSAVNYDVDGAIIEITDDELKDNLGATRHHHRWQIAYKENAETAQVKVVNVVPQTSRSGRVNPVAEVEPTRLSGAMIQRATAHHYKLVLDKGIGPGALIELTRSGEVIPKIERVITPVTPVIPDQCPSCGSELIWDGDYLYCTNNIECPAQIASTMEHFFRVLRNVDLFGSATIEKLYEHGIRSVDQIYKLESRDFINMGFGPKQSENLVEQLARSKEERIEDWRFLAAFGIFRLGQGNCEKLLANHYLENIFELSESEIVKIEGFAEKTASAVIKGLNRIKPLFQQLMSLGFNLERTQLLSEAGTGRPESPINQLQIIFTGTMQHGSREQMEKEAKSLGAKIGKSVTSKTDLLVTGENVGATKITEAGKKNVRIITEEEYLRMIGRF
jgi:DNA ligase (NAD+)